MIIKSTGSAEPRTHRMATQSFALARNEPYANGEQRWASAARTALLASESTSLAGRKGVRHD